MTTPIAARFALFAFLALACLPVGAADFFVTSIADVDDLSLGDGTCAALVGFEDGFPIPRPVYRCTLRAAVQEANALAGGDTIFLSGTRYTLTRVGPEENTGRYNDLDVVETLTIVGAGRDLTTIDASGIRDAASLSGHAIQLTNRAIGPGGAFTMTGVTVEGSSESGIDSDTGFTTTVLTDVALLDNDGNGTRASFDSSYRDCRIAGNGLRGIWKAGSGGGTTSVERCEISMNGGGVYNDGENRLEIIDSTISDNMGQGGVKQSGRTTSIIRSTISGNSNSVGGAGVQFASGIEHLIDSSTISDNVSTWHGGGVAVNSAGTALTVVNSTISGNRTARIGGGVYAFGSVRFQNATVTQNFSDTDADGDGGGGGIGTAGSGEALVRNSIVQGNSAGSGGASGANCSGDVASEGYNLVGGDCSGFSLPLGDRFLPASLGALANNGGPTRTHQPGPSSYAIDGGNSAGCMADTDGHAATPDVLLELDQRGYHRPHTVVAARCDMGALEVPEPGAVASAASAITAMVCLARGLRRESAGRSVGSRRRS